MLSKEFNQFVLRQAAPILWTPREVAPSTESELFGNLGPELAIWTGASEGTIFGDARVNWAFRAIHDFAHLQSGLDFSPLQEIELGRRQAAQCSSDFFATLIYLEVAGQAEHFLRTGNFVQNQYEWTINQLSQRGQL